MIRSLRKHAPTWLTRRMGSQDFLDKTDEPQCTVRQNMKTEFEKVSMKTEHFLEKGQFQEVVEMLHDLPQEFICQCLESFPFKTLNRNIPKSFAIWETILMKLHENEDSDLPYAACDELVLQIGHLLESIEDMPQDNADLIHACKRVLKKVYVQYTGVIAPLTKESKRTKHAIHSLSLHLPLGTDCSAVSLRTAIKQEIEDCVADYQSALEQLENIKEADSLSVSQMITEIYQAGMVGNEEERVIEFHAPNPSQIQLQERLYSNQCIMRALEPNQRKGNLKQLLEMLRKRIIGDKEVIALYGSMRTRNAYLSDMDAVEPWLRKHQRAAQCSITMLKDIKKELQISTPQRPSSPIEAGSELSSSLEDTSTDVSPIPMLQYNTAPTYDHIVNRPPSFRRASVAAQVLCNIGEKEGEYDEADKLTRRYSVPPHSSQQLRSRSVSPMKFLHTNGISRTNGTQNGTTNNGSCKSLNSSRSSSRSLNGKENSSSIHDLNLTSELLLPTQAFRRAKSLNAKGRYAISLVTPQPPRPLVAGRKKAGALLPQSSNALSTSTGNVNKPSKLKKMFRSGSGGLVARWDTHQQREDVVPAGPNLFLELEFKNKELLKKERIIHDLQRRERELTERLCEQAQRQLQESEKFEDILLGANRATVVIQRYEELYSQARMEALDAIEAVQIKGSHQNDAITASTAAMDASDMFNIQLLLEVFKGAYQSAWSHLQQLHCSWRKQVGIPSQRTAETRESGGGVKDKGGIEEEDMEVDGEEGQVCKQMAEKQLESAISVYLRRVCGHQDLTPMMKLLQSRLDSKYFSHPVYAEVKGLPPFTSYMEECVKVAWGLCIQTPHMIINCNETVYDPDLHKRFYNADKALVDIVMYMWPILTQFNGPVLVKGIVLT